MMLVTDPASFQFDLELERGRSAPQNGYRIPCRKRGGEIVGWSRVDEEDFLRFGHLKWHLRNGYACRTIYPDGGQGCERLARAVMGLTEGDGLTVDHINRDRLDNRRENLRVCSMAENLQNQGPYSGSRSQYRGVSFKKRHANRRKPWAAYGNLAGKRQNIGMYATEKEAADAAAAWRRENLPFSIEEGATS